MKQYLFVDGKIFGEVINVFKNQFDTIRQIGGDIEDGPYHILKVYGEVPNALNGIGYGVGLLKGETLIGEIHEIDVANIEYFGEYSLVKTPAPKENTEQDASCND